jgi:flagellar biosynthesis/type III secretory pathway protein FliH
MSMPEPQQAFFGEATVEPPAWHGSTVPEWTPLRRNLREVDDPNFSAKQVQKKYDRRQTDLKQQEAAGYDAGYQSGMQAAEAQLQATLGRYADAVAALAAQRTAWLQQTQEALVKLSLHIAGQVLLTDVAGRHQFTARMVERGLSLLKDADALSLRLPASELAYLQQHHPELLRQPHLSCVEDNSLLLGGGLFQADLGVVDATLEHRLAEMSGQLHAIADVALSPDGTPP